MRQTRTQPARSTATTKMGLQYPGNWKFEGVGFGVPDQAIEDVLKLIEKTATGEKYILELFKSAFGGESDSSNYGWAVTDLRHRLDEKSDNAAEFVDCLWSGIETVATHDVPIPSAKVVNKLLESHDIPLTIEPPHLKLRNLVDIRDDADPHSEIAPDVAGQSYVLRQRIGGGGYGEVHRATRRTDVAGFQYALKILNPSPFVDKERAQQRFRREFRAVQRLQHRAIISFFEAGFTTEGQPFVAMPLIEGLDLVTAAKRVGLRDKLLMFVELLRGVEHAHTKDVLHRDLKPSNVLVRSSDQQPIILDFGAAYILHDADRSFLTSQAVGTLGYIPSEVIADPTLKTPLQDVYACGIMLYEALADRRPDPANYVPLTTIDTTWDALNDIVYRAITGSERRTRSAADMAGQLTTFLDGL